METSPCTMATIICYSPQHLMTFFLGKKRPGGSSCLSYSGGCSSSRVYITKGGYSQYLPCQQTVLSALSESVEKAHKRVLAAPRGSILFHNLTLILWTFIKNRSWILLIHVYGSHIFHLCSYTGGSMLTSHLSSGTLSFFRFQATWFSCNINSLLGLRKVMIFLDSCDFFLL